MPEPIDYSYVFAKEEYIFTIYTNSIDSITIILENVQDSTYWKKELTEESITELTTRLGYKLNLSQFTNILLIALLNQNSAISLSFLSLKEIQDQSISYSGNTYSSTDADIKKYLMINDSRNKTVLYPIQFEYCNKSPDIQYLQRTIIRLKNMIKESKNMAEFIDMRNKIKILESHRKLGAVDYDEIQQKYLALAEENDKSDLIIKTLTTTIEELQGNKRENEKKFLSDEYSKNIIRELEKEIASLKLNKVNDSNSFMKELKEKNKKIHALVIQIDAMKDNEKEYKSKISKLNNENSNGNMAINARNKGIEPNSNSRNKSSYTNLSKSRSNSSPVETTRLNNNSSFHNNSVFGIRQATKDQSSSGSLRKIHNYKYNNLKPSQVTKNLNLCNSTYKKHTNRFSNFNISNFIINNQLKSNNLNHSGRFGKGSNSKKDISPTINSNNLLCNNNMLVRGNIKLKLSTPTHILKKKINPKSSQLSPNKLKQTTKPNNNQSLKILPILLTSTVGTINPLNDDKTTFEKKLKMFQNMMNNK